MRFFSRRRRAGRNTEIAPEEIFLDASNSPAFDRARFEGRLERPLRVATFWWLGATLGVIFLILVARAFQLEVLDGGTFAAESARNSLAKETLFAQRGVIEDRNGVVLAENMELANGDIRREYPIPGMGQVIGYVSYPKKDANGNYYDTAEVGLAGLEAEYDAQLSGVNGEVLVERDALGAVRSQGVVVPAKQGATLRLSLDADLEKKFAQAVADTAQKDGFEAGAGVIMDVHTGGVAAIVSYPSYDPNVMSLGQPAATIALYNSDAGHPFLDHAVQGVYTPGSIVKPFEAAGALTDGIITPSTIIDDPGVLSVPDPYHPGKSFIYTGWKALGLVNVEKAIAWSSDVFFYTVGGGNGAQKGLGIDRLDYWYRAFGLGHTTGIDLPGEAAGVVPSPSWKEATFGEPWYLGDTYHTAIGQYGTQVTPVQMACATAALANGGTLLTPTLLTGQKPRGTAVPVNVSDLAVVRAGMRDGVTSALAQAIHLPYLAVAAKTGTAQVGTRNQFDNSWVEGFFPYQNPEYSFAVVLERGPSGSGEDAVNVMQELFDALHAEGSAYVGGVGIATSTTP